MSRPLLANAPSPHGGPRGHIAGAAFRGTTRWLLALVHCGRSSKRHVRIQNARAPEYIADAEWNGEGLVPLLVESEIDVFFPV